MYYKGCDGVVIVFAMNNRKSFENLKGWLETID